MKIRFDGNHYDWDRGRGESFRYYKWLGLFAYFNHLKDEYSTFKQKRLDKDLKLNKDMREFKRKVKQFIKEGNND